MNEKCRLPHVPGDVLFFTDPTTTEIYTLSLHDALPISRRHRACRGSRLGLVSLRAPRQPRAFFPGDLDLPRFVCAAVADRKSTRLNSSHPSISYAVFCLKKKSNTLQLTAKI